MDVVCRGPWVRMGLGVARSVERAIHTTFPVSSCPTTLQPNSSPTCPTWIQQLQKEPFFLTPKYMFCDSFCRPETLWPRRGIKSYGQFVTSSFSGGESGCVKPCLGFCSIQASLGFSCLSYALHLSVLNMLVFKVFLLPPPCPAPMPPCSPLIFINKVDWNVL